MINVACVGTGYWGKNLVRNFDQLRDAELLYCCDLDPKNRASIGKAYPDVTVTDDLNKVLEDKRVQAVVLATPAVTHYELVKKALLGGKHVYVEKPFTLSVEHAEELAHLSEKLHLTLMVGHLMEYHPGVLKLKHLIEEGQLGKIHYAYAQRVNLGVIRKDENALWSFAPHDISVILFLFGAEPETVTAWGQDYLQKGIEDVVFVAMRFPDKRMAHIHLSWLDPHKIRKLTVVGSKKMVVFDDVEATEKVKIYDKGVNMPGTYETYGDSISLRFGDISIPSIDMAEPLRLECQHFLDCVAKGKKPRSDARDGLRVVKILAAAQRSLESSGAPVSLK